MSALSFAERAASADAALMAYMTRTRCDCEECLGALLRDLMHWADSARIDFAEQLYVARFNYHAEVVDREVADA